jgi:hypothetical protein
MNVELIPDGLIVMSPTVDINSFPVKRRFPTDSDVGVIVVVLAPSVTSRFDRLEMLNSCPPKETKPSSSLT